jgi:CO/xanthine dehydrogenase Mo-binding subunit
VLARGACATGEPVAVVFAEDAYQAEDAASSSRSKSSCP